MKLTNDRGFTILEIFLALFLAGILGASFWSLHQRKARAHATETCISKAWFWSRMAEELEFKLHEWEFLGAKCLTADYPLLSRDESKEEIRIAHIEYSQPLATDMSRPNILTLPAGARFFRDQQVTLCTDDRYFQARVAEMIPVEGKAVATLDVQTSPLGNELLNQGTLVTTIQTLAYHTVPSENFPEKILYEKRSASEQAPIGSGFEKWSLALAADSEKWRRTFDLSFELGECSLKRQFRVAARDGLTGQGRWSIRGDKIEFEPRYEPVQHQP